MFEYVENERKIKEAEIVVGIASYNEADAISYPTHQADLGLQKYFPGKKCAILNCDNHSPDATKDAFLGTQTETPKIFVSTPPDTPGKGYNFENMFRKTHELGAKKIICVDADLESITPEWIKHFTDPLEKGYDYVTPVYARHKYDGTITNNICYPLVYGLLNMNIRQPIGGDFALSQDLADYLILQPWHRTTEQYGIDIFLSMNAILGGFKVAQTGLGAKIHKPSAPKLGPMFLQVVGTAFLTILKNLDTWKDRESIQETEMFGLQKMEKAQDLDMDREAIKQKAIKGFNLQKAQIKKNLKPETCETLEAMFEKQEIVITDDLWINIVYEMMASFKTASDRVALTESLRPLYFGRAFTFMNDTWEMDTPEAENVILEQAVKFNKRRSYLIDLLSA